MMHKVDGTPFTDLDAFVADNPGMGFILVCDKNPSEMLAIPPEKVECFFESTYTQDCYPQWVEDLGWLMLVSDEGDVTDLGPTAAKEAVFV